LMTAHPKASDAQASGCPLAAGGWVASAGGWVASGAVVAAGLPQAASNMLAIMSNEINAKIRLDIFLFLLKNRRD
jgi:hypothetical protein